MLTYPNPLAILAYSTFLDPIFFIAILRVARSSVTLRYFALPSNVNSVSLLGQHYCIYLARLLSIYLLFTTRHFNIAASVTTVGSESHIDFSSYRGT